MTYPVRAAEHVKYEYFILDMMIYRDTLLQFIVYLNFRIIGCAAAAGGGDDDGGGSGDDANNGWC